MTFKLGYPQMRFLALLLASIALTAQPSAVWAQARFALLIGNKDYSTKIGRLKNPIDDVGLIKDALLKVGFDEKNIEVVTNANSTALNNARKRFAYRLKAAGYDSLGFFYYSGHGASSRLDDKGSPSNYIIPIDVDDTKGPFEMFESSVPLSGVVRDLRTTAPLADLIVVFDACRSELRLAANAIDSKTFIAEPLPRNGNNFLSFSTDAASPALDGGDDGGPFAKSLAQELLHKDLYHEQVFHNVSLAVSQATKGAQNPTYFDGFKTRLFFAQTPTPIGVEELTLWNITLATNSVEKYKEFVQHYPGSSKAREAVSRMQAREEEIAWNLAQSNESRDDYESFLVRYPNGRFSQLAIDQISAIAAAEEDRDWRSAKRTGTASDLEDFLGKYPRTKRYQEARELIIQLSTPSTDAQISSYESAWKNAQALDSIPGYQTYLATYSSAPNVKEAQDRLAILLEKQEWEEAKNTKSAVGLKRFAAKFPNGAHVEDAIDLARTLEEAESPSTIKLAMATKGISDEMFKQQKILEQKNLFFPGGTFSVFTRGKIAGRLDLEKAQPIRRLLLTNDLTKLYSGGDDGKVRIWDLNGLEKNQVLSPAHAKRIYALARSDNTHYVATGAWDREVFLWDSNSNVLAGRVQVRPVIYSMAFSPTGRWIAAAGSDGQVDFVRTRSRNVVNRRGTATARTIFALAYLPNKSEDLVLGDASGALRLWSVIPGQETYVPNAHKDKILSLTISPDGQRIASAGVDRSIKIWTNRLKPVLEIGKAHLRYVTSLRFSPDGRLLASGGADGLIRIWNVASGKIAREPFVGHTGDVETMEFSPDGKYLFSSSEDKTVRIWDVDSGRLLFTMVAFSDNNYVIFDPEQRYLASDGIRSMLSSP